MKSKTIPFDAARYLNSPEAVGEYLILAFQEAAEFDDPTEITRALGVVARSKGMTEIAEKAGLSRASLYRSLSEHGRPELATLMAVMKVLGLRLVPERLTTSIPSDRETMETAA